MSGMSITVLADVAYTTHNAKQTITNYGITTHKYEVTHNEMNKWF